MSWAAPDIYWGDADETPSSRKYQLWVDGGLAQDNLPWTSTAVTGFDPGDSGPHTFVVRAVNQCGVAKAYEPARFAVSNCSPADLSIGVTNAECWVPPGGSTTYAIAVTNSGPSPVTEATVTNPFPEQLQQVTWSCTGSGGGVCTDSGAGPIVDTVDLPADATLLYVATGTVAAGATGVLLDTATVTHPVEESDPVPGNNVPCDADALQPPLFCDGFERGDATAWSTVQP